MYEFFDTDVKQNEVTFNNMSNEFISEIISPNCNLHYLSNTELVIPEDSYERKIKPYGKSLLLQSLNNSFSNHIPFSLSPEAVWYTISYEIATHIKLNSKKYRELFTDNKSKKEIEVEADFLIYGVENDWSKVINLFREPISEIVPKSTQELLILEFTNSTEEGKLANLAIFMDMMSHYYNFTVHTRCGIPKIRITGAKEDWEKIIKHTNIIGQLFPELNRYTKELNSVLNEIKYAVESEESKLEFWKSIYKYNSMSGGNIITGWINNLIAYDYSKEIPVLKETNEYIRMTNIPTHISKVPFIWDYMGKNIKMELISGFVSNKLVDGFMTPGIGFGIVELK